MRQLVKTLRKVEGKRQDTGQGVGGEPVGLTRVFCPGCVQRGRMVKAGVQSEVGNDAIRWHFNELLNAHRLIHTVTCLIEIYISESSRASSLQAFRTLTNRPSMSYPPIEPFETGNLKVSDIHTLYYEVSGKEDGNPVIFVHGWHIDIPEPGYSTDIQTGGPGGGTDVTDRTFFNPEKYKIILFDQRGAGKSTPSACLEENTTWDLVKDMELLREKLNVEKWHVFGGSWGSTLSLAYAQSHPDRVKSLTLRGICTLRKSELRFFYQDGASHLFPEAWDEYLAPIPEDERDDLMKAYHRRLHSDDEATRLIAAKAWIKWEMWASKLYVDPKYIAQAEVAKFALAFALVENHYFVNEARYFFLLHAYIEALIHGLFQGFMRDGQILEKQSIDKIRHIPTVIIQGRYDVACPATTAYALKKAFPEATLHIVPDAGHSSREPGTTKLLVETTDKFADIL
ncbi:hypothetical protein D9756_003460 [Leucocoprinus leucothites]|uniref:Proline iminopeptidase n=1 Tax=Leucocoprinus leucothites TaxID=201217 RepID=A0A8H5LJG0_9AGAR|nr:hypothetical protein D9756_003460 [Leucoagaricus leucothites]